MIALRNVGFGSADIKGYTAAKLKEVLSDLQLMSTVRGTIRKRKSVKMRTGNFAPTEILGNTERDLLLRADWILVRLYSQSAGRSPVWAAGHSMSTLN